MQTLPPLQQAALLEHHRAALLAHQGLSAEDVATMRLGRMSPGALRAIAKGKRTAYLLIGGGVLVAALGIGIGVALLRMAPEDALRIGGLRVTVPMLVGPLGAFIMILSAVFSLGRIRRAPRLSIVVMEGSASSGVGRRGRRFLAVAGVPLYEQNQPVVRDVAPLLVPGAPARVFLTESDGLTSGIVVGIEPLPAPPAAAARCPWYEGKTL